METAEYNDFVAGLDRAKYDNMMKGIYGLFDAMGRDGEKTLRFVKLFNELRRKGIDPIEVLREPLRV